MLEAIERKSLSDSVYEQLRDRIVAGDMAPGDTLPSERELCERLGVNRGALREALKRLEQARLVTIRHGGGTRVLDYRRTAGPELLTQLLMRADGAVDLRVARSVVEMRGVLAPDIARLAARRGGDGVIEELEGVLADMRAADGDAATLQDCSMRFWEVLVRASENVAYELAYNTLRETYDKIRAALRGVLRSEFTNLTGYEAIARAVGRGDEKGAERAARRLLEGSTGELTKLLQSMGEAR